ncbi:MAG: hypothetical protein CFE43_18985 [Burkholderiales bacterium PBB3]|nr:MAG: hypothetical protein CFE43_18985 [Burkholderiales bacterium PBB3]
MTTTAANYSSEHKALHSLLDAQLQLPAEYRDQLTSHLPMALQALHSLGASPGRMYAFYAAYAKRFDGMHAPTTAQPVADWRSLRGQPDVYPALFASLNTLVVRDGIDATLRALLPDLLPGVAAAAFHGLIRTAHAVQSSHAGEVAAALAYWAWRWQPLAPAQAHAVPMPLTAWSQALVRDAQTWRTDGPLISVRMDQAAQGAVYQSLADALQPFADLQSAIARLAALAAERYVASPNFTVLHMITGMRALRVLSPWIESGEGVQPILIRAFTAAYLAARVVPQAIAPEPRLHTWSEVIAAAIASDDDHVIKLVHACREEASVYGEGNYLRAAALAIG